MNIEIGSKWSVDNETVEVLACKDEVIMVKENDGNLVFILGGLTSNKNGFGVVSHNKMSYTVTDTEMLNCINTYFADSEELVSAETVVKAVRNTYYKIPTKIAEVIAEWYMR